MTEGFRSFLKVLNTTDFGHDSEGFFIGLCLVFEK